MKNWILIENQTISHLKTGKHIENLSDGASSSKQDNVDAPSTDRKQFNLDLCEALVDANIPIWKLENKKFKEFLEKYTKHVVPDESKIRKNYVDIYYNNTMSKIRTNVGNSNKWVSINESTDTTGRKIANMIIGILDARQESNIYLLNSQQLDKTNGKQLHNFLQYY